MMIAPDYENPGKRSRRRRILYGLIISTFSVVLFFGCLEGGLRLIGYGHSPRFYRIQKLEDGTKIYRENQDFAYPYFSAEVMRKPQPFRLKYDKPASEYRIFLMGSSAAMGDPEASFSISRILERMLEHSYKELDFKVINTAMTAINSHVVRRIAGDCAELSPYLFIVYEGNNEVIGPFGPAGVLTPFFRSEAAINAMIHLRQTRIGQLLDGLIKTIGKHTREQEEWGGMQMFLNRKIARDDPGLLDVERLFLSNLKRIVDYGESKGISTVMCTILTNQRDFAPFQSDHRTGLTDEIRRDWDQYVERGDQALLSGNLGEAENAYLKAWALDDQFAALAYKMGRVYLQENDDVQARRFLRLALDLDTLRFRTDSRLNQAIRSGFAQENRSWSLLDLERIIAEASPHKLIGDEWLYEHVHLNFYANYQLASILFESVSNELLKHRRVTEKQPQVLDYEDIVEMMAYTYYEQGMIAHELLNRFQKPPFTAQIDYASRLSTWQERVNRIDQVLSDKSRQQRILQDYETAIELNPGDWVIERNFGMALLAFDMNEEAVIHLERSLRVIDDDIDTLFSLGVAYSQCGREKDANTIFHRLKQSEPRFPDLQKWLDQTS